MIILKIAEVCNVLDDTKIHWAEKTLGDFKKEYKLTDEILKPDITVNKENILIFHTHSCESYTPSEKYQYKKTGNFRTTDKKYSVIRVAYMFSPPDLF